MLYLCQPEQLAQFLLVESRSDHGHHACRLGSGLPDLALARHVVELEPSAVGVLYDALGSYDLAALIQAVDDLFDLGLSVLVAGLGSDFIEDLIRIVAMVMVVMMVMMFMLVIVVIIVVLMVVMVMFVIVIVVIVVMMVMVVMMLVLIVVIVMIVVVMMLVLFCHMDSFYHELCFKIRSTLDSR